MINKYNNNSLHGVFFYDSNIWCKILKKKYLNIFLNKKIIF